MKRKMISLFWIVIIIFLGVGCNDDNNNNPTPEPPPDTNAKYENPVFKPVFADPTVLDNRERDGYFYAYSTQDNWGTTPEEERIVPIIRSKDLVNWEDMGDAFDGQPDWNGSQNLFWAPDITYRNGKYYLYYSLAVWGGSNPAIGVAVSDTPDGKFTDLGKILDSQESGVPVSIDPFIFEDNDGQLYLFWGSFHGIYGVPLKEDGITAKLDEKFKIAGDAFEAPYIFRKNGYYYFFGSVGSCCDGEYSYHVTVARSQTLKGPYLDINGNDIMDANSWDYGINDLSVNVLYKERAIVAPGHNSAIVIDDNGQEWILYHAIVSPNFTMPNGAARRPLFVDKVTWYDNGWPKIGANGNPTYYETDAPVFK
jgi:arabinan endo-1,5-alpha-L-arabinosidase